MAYHELLKTALARLVVNHDISTADLSSQLDISAGSISRWKKEYVERYTSGHKDLDDILTRAREQVADAIGVDPTSVKVHVDLTPY